MWAPQWVSEDIGGLPVLVGMADAGRPRAADRSAASAAPPPGSPRKRLIREHDLPMKLSGVDYVAATRPDDDLLHRAAPRRLPRARPRPLRHAERQGRAAPAVGARRGPAHRRHRLVRPRAVLLDVPRRLRAGQRADGQGPGPAAQPAAHLRRVRPADVLPEVRAPAVPGLRRAGARPSASRSRRRTATGRSSGTTCPARRSSCGWPPTGARTACALASVCSSPQGVRGARRGHRGRSAAGRLTSASRPEGLSRV